MCAIVGKLFFDENHKVEEDVVQSMAQCLTHRGPDDEGIYCQGQVGLGHRRLSIIDLSPAGHQPMSNENGNVWIVYNGEIYNFQSLKPDLEKKGHKFRSHSDTETIIHLYEEHGVNCLKYLRGMFAFAIWDSKKKLLFLARDRVGKKPLKYYLGKDFIVFASELKALLKDPSVPKEVDYEAIHHYLTFQYVPHPMTGFKGIKKLAPAHYMTIDLAGSTPRVETKRYWQLDYSKKLKLSEEEWKRRILDKLEESVKLRMISDVPLGAFLSGGVDSSAVVAMMAKNSSKPLRTFSIGFADEKFNELPYARMVAKRYGTQHQEFIVEPNAIEVLPKLVYHYEEPYADSSALPTYYLSEMTRKHVTVALNGDGGDENFAGYPWYLYQKLADILHHYPLGVFIQAGASILDLLGQNARTTLGRRANIFFQTYSKSAGARYAHYFTSSYFTDEEKLGMYTDEFKSGIKGESSDAFFSRSIYEPLGLNDALDAAFASDIHSYLADDLLVKVDIASMAHSLEARSPLLDHEFMELAAHMPSALKLSGWQTKAFFKRILYGVISDEILQGKKRGFMVPLGAWFRGELRSFAHDTLLRHDTRLHEFLKQDSLTDLLRAHEAGRIDHGSRIWSLIALEQWIRTYFPKHI